MKRYPLLTSLVISFKETSLLRVVLATSTIAKVQFNNQVCLVTVISSFDFSLSVISLSGRLGVALGNVPR